MRVWVPGAALLFVVGCGGEVAAPDTAEWSGSISTEGNVTTVINRSGGVWEGEWMLAEELSIGQEEGDEPYLLGSVASVTSDGDRVWVVDRQVPAVRVYDGSGVWLADVGGAGQGPGEYESPASVRLGPDGAVFVRDDGRRLILIYGADGEHRESYPMSGGLRTGTQMVIGPDGTPYTVVVVESLPDDPHRLWILGMQAHGPEGPFGEPVTAPSYEFERGVVVVRQGGGTSMNYVPFWPTESWTLGPELQLVSGVSTDYRLFVDRPDGSRLVIERAWDPVAVNPEEGDWHRRRITAQMRRMDPGFTWNGPEVPASKPPFTSPLVSASGEIWVVRPGPGQRLTPCAEEAESVTEYNAEPCWRDTLTFDVFGADGRFHGSLDAPAGMSLYPPPWIDGDRLTARVEDEFGTLRVKRYRRVPIPS